MKYIYKIFVLVLIIGVGVFVWYRFSKNQTIEELLTENEDLKTAITNLNQENQIGYAKVQSQEYREGQLFTRIKFVATDPKDISNRVIEKECEIEGDVVHFDALIVTFGSDLVMDGKERAMYLWRRIYGEKVPPEQGFPIEEVGKSSPRYARLCQKLSLEQKTLFWDEIWQLSNDPKRLERLGVKAIFGNVVYRKLKPGLIYVFKVSTTGSIYPEIIPDL
jgi:hypothetical protein